MYQLILYFNYYLYFINAPNKLSIKFILIFTSSIKMKANSKLLKIYLIKSKKIVIVIAFKKFVKTKGK